MFYLFDVNRSSKNYGSVDETTSNLNGRHANTPLGSPDDKSNITSPLHDEEDPLIIHYNADDENEHAPCTPPRNEQVLNVDDAINRLGIGRFHYQILIAAGLLLAADSIQNVLLSFLSKSQMKSLFDGSRHTSDKAWLDNTEEPKEMTDITMVVFPGALVGALVLGMLADMIGRRPVFCYLTAPIIALFGMGMGIVSASAALSNEWLLLTSFMVAFGVGGLSVPFDTFSEVLSITHRGRYLIYLQIFGTLGALVIHLILDTLLLKDDHVDVEKALFIMVPQLHATVDDAIAFSASKEWVVLVVICAIPCVFATVLAICAVPESPRWLVARGYPDRALEVLRRAAETNGTAAGTLYPKGTLLYTNEHAETWSSVCSLCAADWMQITSALWATYFGLAFLDHGTMTLTVSVFSNDARQQDYQAIFRSTSELCGLFLALCLIDKWGRIPTQRWSYLGGGVSCVIISLLISPVDDQNDNLLLVLAFVARMLVTGGTAATWIATSEVLSTEIRASRHAIANAVGRIGGFVASYVFLQIGSLPFTGVVLFCISVWTGVVCGGLPETNCKEMGLAHIPVSLLASTTRRRHRKGGGKQNQWLS